MTTSTDKGTSPQATEEKTISDAALTKLTNFVAAVAMSPSFTILGDMSKGSDDAAKTIKTRQDAAQKAIETFLPEYTKDIAGNAGKMALLSQDLVDAQALTPEELAKGLKGNLTGDNAFRSIALKYYGRAPKASVGEITSPITHYKDGKGFRFVPIPTTNGNGEDSENFIQVFKLDEVKPIIKEDAKGKEYVANKDDVGYITQTEHVAKTPNLAYAALVKAHCPGMGFSDEYLSDKTGHLRNGKNETSLQNKKMKEVEDMLLKRLANKK